MKTCRHLGSFDLLRTCEPRPTGIVCQQCLDVIVKALGVHLHLMWDAEDDTSPNFEISLRHLYTDLTGKTHRKPKRDVTTYNRLYQRKRRAAIRKAEAGGIAE